MLYKGAINKMEESLVYRLRKRAEIRRQIKTRKSVQEGQPDRIADLLEEAANKIEELEGKKSINNSEKELLNLINIKCSRGCMCGHFESCDVCNSFSSINTRIAKLVKELKLEEIHSRGYLHTQKYLLEKQNEKL
jgi:hypothetical protein